MAEPEPTTTRRLSRDLAVRTALRIIDERGLDALSMRVVARELGSPVMSLYRHVASREDLEDGVVASLVGGVGPLPPDAPWDVTVRAWGTAYRAMVAAHPNAVGLLWSRPLAGYRAQRDAAERVLGELRRAGLTPRRARLHLRAALVVIAGACQIDAGSAPLPDGAATTLRAEGYPLLGGLVARVGRDGDELFALVLDMVIAGIARDLPAGA